MSFTFLHFLIEAFSVVLEGNVYVVSGEDVEKLFIGHTL